MNFKKQQLVIAINGTYSEAFTVENWAIFYGVLFPDMDSGDIGMEISIDAGNNFYPVLDPVDGSDAVLCSSGSDPGWIDFSDWVRFLPDNQDYRARFTCATQSSGAVTLTVIMRGA